MPSARTELTLSELVSVLVEEIADGTHRAQMAQEEEARELAAIMALDPADVASRLVPLEAAEAWCDKLLQQADGQGGWPRSSAEFLRLAARELDVRLARETDFDRWGLTQAGRERVVKAARTRLAAEQLETVRTMLVEGPPRVRVTSGEVVVKLDMQLLSGGTASRTTAEAASTQPRTPGRVAPLRTSCRILVRPARNDDRINGHVFGEIRLTFAI
jgi:hypothetical protein